MRHTTVAAALMISLSPIQRTVFRSTIDEVRVDVLVTDGTHPIVGLTSKDFELRDAGVVQTIENVETSDVPFSMALALDTSSSMEGIALQQLQDGARAAVDALRPNDRAAILTFNAAIGAETSWTADHDVLDSAIARLQAAGTTSLFDSATAAIIARDAEPGRRNLLIVFTDGEDTSSWLPDTAAYDLAARTDIVVYGITTGPATPVDSGGLHWRSGIRLASDEPIVSSRDFLTTLSARTGGKHLRSAGADLRRTFAQIVAEFRQRYVLWYRPEGVAQSGWHPIDVRVRARRAHVTARRGYQR